MNKLNKRINVLSLFDGISCGVDLEFYSCRFSGRPRTLAVLEQGKKWKLKRQKRK